MTLDFEKEKLIEGLKKAKPQKVLVQLGEGMKKNALEIAEWIEELGIGCVFSGETCWGGCSLALHEAEDVGADLIVHFGHAEFFETDFPVLYIEVKDILDIKPLLEKSLETLEQYQKIGLSYSIQHKHDAENIQKFYEDSGKKVLLSKKIGAVACEGHVLGCQYAGLRAIEDEVDCFIIIGNQFHSMGAVLAVQKPVIFIDVYNDSVRNMQGTRENILRQRAFLIDKLKEAKTVGVIVGLKPGQKFGCPKKISRKLKELGKKVIIISMDEITPEKTMNFYSIDAFVDLACPRVAIDDFAKFSKPLLTCREALVAVGEISWEEIIKEGVI